MSVVLCAPFNSDDDLCGAISPVNTRMGINTSIKKFGAGSIEVTSGTSGNLQWTGLSPGIPGNEGAIGVWWYIETPETTRQLQFFASKDGFSDKSWLLVQIDKDGTISPAISMFDEDENSVVNEGMSESAFANDTWHYIELNWLWNDGSGITELSVNGTVVASSTDGNTESRETTDELGFQLGINHLGDDLTVWDTRQHVGNFSVPTSPNCVCAAALKRPFRLGSPFGMNRMH